MLFVTPIAGTPFVDWTIVNYFDQDSGPGVRDYQGGAYSYDGHLGIDFTLANFAAMDDGIAVLAARGGTIIDVHDGEYDRNTPETPQSGAGNYVRIAHDNGIITEYYHLRTGSISVSIGDRVAAGQEIAQVGSSGNSSDAHLHFQVSQNHKPVDTYDSPELWWINPLTYAGDRSGSLDHGITDHLPDFPELRERPRSQSTFSNEESHQVVVWLHLYGAHQGDSLSFSFTTPGGQIYSDFSFITPQIRYGWQYAYINLPKNAETGEWSVTVTLNEVQILADKFSVEAQTDFLDLHLSEYNHSKGSFKSYILANLQNPAAIVDTAADFGLSNQMLADIYGAVTRTDVITFFSSVGIDSEFLDLDLPGLSTWQKTVGEARDFILNNLETPQVILDTAFQYGLTNNNLALIYRNVTELDVVTYFDSIGLNSRYLDDARSDSGNRSKDIANHAIESDSSAPQPAADPIYSEALEAIPDIREAIRLIGVDAFNDL